MFSLYLKQNESLRNRDDWYWNWCDRIWTFIQILIQTIWLAIWISYSLCISSLLCYLLRFYASSKTNAKTAYFTIERSVSFSLVLKQTSKKTCSHCHRIDDSVFPETVSYVFDLIQIFLSQVYIGNIHSQSCSCYNTNKRCSKFKFFRTENRR